MRQIRIAIIDDERLIREGLKIVLSSYEDIEVVSLGQNGLEALDVLRSNSIDLVLMDIRMPVCDGVQGTKLIKEEFPEVKVLILTTFKDVEYIQEALRNGASGYLLKDSSHRLIYEGIKAAMSGNIVFHPDAAEGLFDLPARSGQETDWEEQYGLSARECQLIQEIAAGLSNREIGEKLYLSEGTIKNYVSTILAKLDLRDRTQIAIFAFRSGMMKGN